MVVLGSHYPNPVADGSLILLSPPNTVLRKRPATSEPSAPRGPTCADTRPQGASVGDAPPPPSKWPPKAHRGERKVDPVGNLGFAGVVYNVGRAWAGRLVEVFTTDGMFCIVSDGTMIRNHPARHSLAKEQAALNDRRRGVRA